MDNNISDILKGKVLLAVFSLLCVSAYSQHGYFSVMSYNCENVFDTIHDEGKNDYDFLPDGSHHWSRYRMYQKLKGIAKVIAAADVHRPVDIIGLCEVENDSVLQYLTERTALHRVGYRYVMTHSDDARGVDVAILYSPFTFNMLNCESVRASGVDIPTRDILHVSGIVANRDTVDVYMCHFPSKLGGKAAEVRADRVAECLMTNIDSVRNLRATPYIIVMGDFNADYSSSLIRSGIGASRLLPPRRKKGSGTVYSPTDIVDLMSDRRDGTYKYRGQWSSIDHIFVSGSLLSASSAMHTSYDDSGILTVPFLLEDDKTYGGKKPYRTFYWTKYNGGISDHLPVWARFRLLREESF